MPYGPEEEYTISFGFDLASATSSFTFFTGIDGWTTMISGSAESSASSAIWSSEYGDLMP